MCFSAPVSFGAAVTLTAIGAVSVGRAPSRSYAPLAAIPLLFAAQQACEGAVWLALERAPYHVSSTPLVRAFLFFALLVWPAYVPFALLLIERVRARRAVLLAFLGLGAGLGAYLMACASLRASNACIAYDNLYYWVQIDAPLKHVMPAVYLAVIVAPMVASSARGTSVLALAVTVAFGTTAVLYRVGFASVWCFFAAILSAIVAVVVRATTPSRGTSARGSRASQ